MDLVEVVTKKNQIRIIAQACLGVDCEKQPAVE
jgi:hypothetical protein